MWNSVGFWYEPVSLDVNEVYFKNQGKVKALLNGIKDVGNVK